MIRLHALGPLDLLDRQGGHQVLSVLAQPKRVGVLIYLAVAAPRNGHSRDKLLATFWPDSSNHRARNALNQTVFVLRRSLGRNLFIKNGDTRLGVDSNHLWCDVWALENALQDGRKKDALELYRGNFLDGFEVPGCLEFERWADGERSRLKTLATAAVLSLSQELEATENPVGALEWIRRAREWEEHDESLLRRQVELLLALGDRVGAIRQYEAFASRLSVDLGMEPSEELQRILHQPAAVSVGQNGAELPGGSPAAPNLRTGEPIPPPPGNKRRWPIRRTGVTSIFLTAAVIAGAVWANGSGNTGGSTGVRVGNESEFRRTVGVLPLENVTGDPAFDYLGSIVADEILQKLARTGLGGLGPILSWTSRPDDPDVEGPPQQENGNPIEVSEAPGLLVTGSICDRDGSLTFQTRVIHGETGTILLAVDTVMGSFLDPGPATERLGEQVAGALAMVLDPYLSDLVGVATHPPSFQAYQRVADGIAYLDRTRSVAGNRERLLEMHAGAEAAFLEAAASSPRFTLPLIFILDASLAPQDSILEALRPLRDGLPPWERAMLDCHLADRAGDLGGLYEARKRVAEISPTPQWKARLAEAALRVNRPREARALLLELGEDQRWSTESNQYWARLGEAEMLLGNPEAAIQNLRQARAMAPDNAGNISFLVQALARAGRGAEAAGMAADILKSTGHVGTYFLRYHLPKALVLLGFEEEGRRLAEIGLETFSHIEAPRPDYVAATYVAAGRYEEAWQFLTGLQFENLIPASRMEAYTLLSYMAALEGWVEEAERFSELAATVHEPQGGGRTPYGVMAQTQAAAHLGDRAAAVRHMREAYRLGLPHGAYLFTRWDLRPLKGYQPFEDLVRPKG